MIANCYKLIMINAYRLQGDVVMIADCYKLIMINAYTYDKELTADSIVLISYVNVHSLYVIMLHVLIACNQQLVAYDHNQ